MKIWFTKFIRRAHVKVGNLLGFEAVTREYFIPLEINEKVGLIDKCLSFTGIGKSGLIDNLMAANYVDMNRIEGDIVEAGVHKGGSIAILSLSLNDDPDRKFWCYDTYSGMPEPGRNDSEHARTLYLRRARGDGYSNWCDTSLVEVKANLASLQVPLQQFKFIVGKVENSLIAQENLPQKISILRLDTDWYESTKAELEILYPLVVPGGVIIIDDYGKWSGSKMAVDEYFSDKIRPFMFPSSHRRILIKP